MPLGRYDTQFIGERRAGCQHSIKDVLQLIVIAQDLEQRLMARALLADTQQVFRGGI
jgi:hypothetical protein